jgi:micrococcal nuclease
MSANPRYYPAELFRVVDGDTLELLVDVGFGILTRQKFRLARIDAPEMGTSEGRESKAFVQSFFDSGKECQIESHKGDRYGRWICELTKDGINLSDRLLESGNALPWPKGS